MNGFFITGTDTEIGKTFVTAALTRALAAAGHRVAPIKSLAAGQTWRNSRWINEDVAELLEAQDLGLSDADVGPLQFREPCAPHIAAKLEGRAIDRDALLHAIRATAAKADIALVEGVGGFRVPLTAHWDTADLALDLGLPVILVVGLRLGCINHALLTAEAIRARGLTLGAWVANTADPHQSHVADNLASLQAGLKAPCLGHIPRLSDPLDAPAHLDISPLVAFA
ncbi:dethiobiotin synthase [Roseateles sp. DC23W]|uniref:ATP-dependent dethiobiotin synthetase BioD n=1 Tax=Pelomonas dachongensis TaxID=3299029 RepID=A0ABW7ER67_9BURK